MQTRKQSIQIIVCVTEQDQKVTTQKMLRLSFSNLVAYARKLPMDGCLILLKTQEIKTHSAQLQKIRHPTKPGNQVCSLVCWILK